MMRPLLTLALCGAMSAPGGLLAQEIPAPDAAPVPALDVPPLPPGPEPGPPLEPQAAPAKADIAPALDGATATTVAPVVVEGQEPAKGAKLVQKAGAVGGGVIGGVAGAAVAGPVGKFAGALVGKGVARTVLGGGRKAKSAQIRPAQTAPSADQAAASTTELSQVPPLREAAADPESPTP